MKANRKDLLQRLLCVAPGISKNETIHQSSCVVFRKGRLYTLSQEVACSMPSGLSEGMEGAVRMEELVEFLKLWPKDEVDIDIGDGLFKIRGGRTKIAMEPEIKLPIHGVELPKKWVAIPEELSTAASLCEKVISRKARIEDGFFGVCCHMTPKWLEASDNNRYVRYNVPTFVAGPVLVRGRSLAEMADLGMTKAAETEGWLHFRNTVGLRLSVRRHTLDKPYPDYSKFLKSRGKEIKFPPKLAGIIKRCAIFGDESGCKVTLHNGRMTVEGANAHGQTEEGRCVDFDGSVSFMVPPKFLIELVEKHASAEITEGCLRAKGDNYIYLSSLEFCNGE